MKTKKLNHKARKMRIGKVEFTEQGMGFFVGYTKCEQCNTQLKVILQPDEAREFASAVGVERPKIREVVAKKVYKKLGGV